jgi:hypothetical protein
VGVVRRRAVRGPDTAEHSAPSVSAASCPCGRRACLRTGTRIRATSVWV